MNIWHGTLDTPPPLRPKAGQPVRIRIGTSPVEPGQSVCVRFTRRARGEDSHRESSVLAEWVDNRDERSYWRADLGPFARGDVIDYRVEGLSARGPVSAPGVSFEVLPRLWLAILWHQHQPLYRDASQIEARGAYSKPWVRLHALRDYYSMAALAGEQPGVHVTINLTPVLLRQLEEYVHEGASDRALDLTLIPAASLSLTQREEILRTFFDADWHNQIFIHSRYRELFAQRGAHAPFSDQDLCDLQMWFNLAWFGKEFRDGDLRLVTGEIVCVRRFIEQGRGFSVPDIADMAAEQLKILRAIVPVHRHLQDLGTIEISTTPFYHPILPLLVDTDRATLDRPSTCLPLRFSHPEDADTQVRLAIEQYRDLFGRAPRGMWPAEGAVAEFVLPYFAGRGLRWIATDQGVLARSGKWGYRAELPEVLCRAYQAEGVKDLSIFFRATHPSDEIGFHFQTASDEEATVRGFLERLKTAYAFGPDAEDRILTLALDGENAWGSYRDDGRPFLKALYRALANDTDIQTVTFSEYLDHRARVGTLEPTLSELANGSWIDELGSAPGTDLGTWIGEPEENQAWNLLGKVRDALAAAAPSDLVPAALHALYAAEGSDWFWWFGDDQDSGSDQEFDDLFRSHLRSALLLAKQPLIPELDVHIVPHAVAWTFSEQPQVIRATERLVVRTNCPGKLEWWHDGTQGSAELVPVGGVMAGVNRYERTLGPFREGSGELAFRFLCQHPSCRSDEPLCRGSTHRVHVLADPVAGGHR